MYKIKEIIIDNFNNTIEIINGLKTYQIKDKYITVNDFWGDTKLIFGEFVDYALFEELKDMRLISYVNEYIISELVDGYKSFCFNISSPQEQIDGYIVIVKYATDIKTDGEILFKRYPTEIVVMLKDENYLELSNKKIKVINNELCLVL